MFWQCYKSFRLNNEPERNANSEIQPKMNNTYPRGGEKVGMINFETKPEPEEPEVPEMMLDSHLVVCHCSFFFFFLSECQRAELSLDCSHTTLNIFMLRNEAENGTKICQDGTLRGNHPEDISSVLSF